MPVQDNTIITSALEDYLSAIYKISASKSNVRMTDIAAILGISKPSVNRAVNTLKKQGLVSHEPYGAIILTEYGKNIGAEFQRRHTMIKKFLINVLGLNDSDAEKESCRIAHGISSSTLEKMELYMSK